MSKVSVVVTVLLVLGGCASSVEVARAGIDGSGKETSSHVTDLLIRPTRTAAGQISPIFREGRTNLFCTFRVQGLAPGTAVTVHWRLGDRELARNELVTSAGTRVMSADLSSSDPLPAGTYEVQVRLGDRTEARTTFRILGEPGAQAAQADEGEGDGEPGASSLMVTTSEDCSFEDAPRANAVIRLAGGAFTANLCFEYANMARGSRLLVQWFRGNNTSQPLAVTTFTPIGSGDLSASFTDSGALSPGAYHVRVMLDGRELARRRFVVGR